MSMYKNAQVGALGTLAGSHGRGRRCGIGQHSGCGTRDYLRTPGHIASGVQLPVPGTSEVEDEMSYSCTSKCVLFEISLAVVCWLRLLATTCDSRGEILLEARARHRCHSRPDGGQPFTRFTLASSCPRRSAQGAWLDDTATLLCNCRREKPTIGISPSGAVASKDANNQLMLLVLTVLLLI